MTDCFFSITQLSHLMSFYFLAHDLNVTVTSHFTSAALSAIMSLLQSWSTWVHLTLVNPNLRSIFGPLASPQDPSAPTWI